MLKQKQTNSSWLEQIALYIKALVLADESGSLHSYVRGYHDAPIWHKDNPTTCWRDVPDCEICTKGVIAWRTAMAHAQHSARLLESGMFKDGMKYLFYAVEIGKDWSIDTFQGLFALLTAVGPYVSEINSPAHCVACAVSETNIRTNSTRFVTLNSNETSYIIGVSSLFSKPVVREYWIVPFGPHPTSLSRL